MRELLPKDFYVDFVGKRKFWVTVSAVAVLISHLLFWTIGPNWSIDFTGGTEIEVKFTQPVTIGEVREALVVVGVGDDAIQQVGDVGDNQFLFRTQGASAARPEELAKLRGALTETFGAEWISDIAEDAQVGSRTTVTYKGDQVELGRVQSAVAGFKGASVLASTEDNTFYVRLPGLAEEISASLTAGLGDRGVDILRTDSVGPKVGDSLRVGGILSMGITMLMLLLYVSVRFDFEFAPGAILCLFHDASIVCGIWVLTGQEFGLSMISALLTLLGYSINDTIVVYDRIRENLEKYRRADFGKLINDSINQTLSRTIITSGATMLSMVPFLIWGGPVLQQFARAMLIGMVVGCYSTIYVASPLTILLRDNREGSFASSGSAVRHRAVPRTHALLDPFSQVTREHQASAAMTRSELVEATARQAGVPRPTAERVVNVLFSAIRDALARGDRVEVRGFGSFQARQYRGYTGRNPRTGATIVVAPKVLPVFKVGKELRARVNGSDPD